MIRSFAALCAVLPSLALAQLNFPGGNVPPATIWGVPGVSQTVTLAGDITIPAGTTLTILPGTVITAAATDNIMRSGGTTRVDVFVEGSLVVQENAGETVTFTGPSTGTGTWGGLIVSAGSTVNAGSTNFQRMASGIRVTAGAAGTTTVTLNNVAITNSAGGMSFAGSSGTTVYTLSNVTIAGATSAALTHSYGTTSISRSVFRDTTGYGISMSGGAVTVDRSTISFNSGYGVYGECNGSGSIAVTNSIVSHNGSPGLGRSGCSFVASVSSSNNLVWGNSSSWSATTPTTDANLSTNNFAGVSQGTGTLLANPLFLNVATRDLRITTRSPARRPTGTDIGAFVYAGDATPLTGLQGYLHTNQTLSGAITVTGDLTIPAGITVLVDPGTTFTFANTDVMGSGNNAVRGEIIVLGTLQAVGTAVSSIVFTTGTASDRWYGLRVTPGASVSIAQARFDKLLNGIEVNANTGNPTSFTFSNSSVAGPGCLSFTGSSGTSTSTLSGVTLSGCTSAAVSHAYGTTSITGSVLRDTTGYGISMSGGAVTVDRSTISFNSGYGVYGECNGSGSIAVTNSIVSHNGSPGLGRSGCSFVASVSSSNNLVWGNSSSWSATTPTTDANLSTNNFAGVSQGAGTLLANPLFLNVATRDLRITTRSPARRPTGIDIGAFAYAGDATPLTGLQGYLHTGQTLSGAISITGDLTIPAGVTVLVDPGTTFTFANTDVMGSGNNAVRSEIVVAGTLQAIGTAPSPIVFTASATDRWYGVRVTPGGAVSLAQARFDKLLNGIEVNASSLGPTSFTLSNSSVAGPGCLSFTGSSGTSTSTLSGVTLSGCSSAAVSHAYGTTTITGSVLRDTTGYGISMAGGSVSVDRSTIAFNSGYGVYGECNGSGSIAVTNSIVSHNGSPGLGRSGCSFVASVSSAYNNVWGNSSTGLLMPPTGADVSTNNFAGVSQGTGSQSANPLFTAQTATPRDLTLTSTSPSIGAGRVGAVAGGAPIDQGAFPFTVGPIMTVVIFPTSPSITAGATRAFAAQALDANNNPVPTTFTWSAVPSAGNITAAGLLTASCTPGAITNGVSATAPNGVVGRTNVTITLGAPNNVAITPSSPTVPSQGTQQFTAAVRDSCNNALAGATITWSAAPQAGSITGTGLFTAGCTRGTYMNAVTATAGAISASIPITVGPGEVAAVSISPSNPTVTAGMTQLFAATAADGCGNTVMGAPITWSTTAPGSMIAGTGIFTAGQSNGTFPNSVTAATPGASTTVSSSTGVTISGGSGGAVATITISPTSTSIGPGATQQFTATALNAMGQPVAGAPITWSVVNGGGSINASGLFTAGNTAGAFANTVRAASGSASATVSLTVTTGPVATVTVTPTMATLAPGGMTTFTAQARDAFNNLVASTFTWTASAAAGTVTQGGAFTASSTVGTYNAAVTATVGTVSGSASITIQAGALASLTITPPLAMVQAGGTAGFTVVGRDSMGSVVAVTPTWSVVSGGGTINASGIFQAGTAAGTFANTVRAEANGLTAFASVQVSPGPILTVNVAPGTATVASGATQQFTAQARDAFNNAVPVGFTWTSQPAAGTINAGGLFTASATAGAFPNAVTATAGGVNGFASVTVTGGTGGGSAGGGSAGGSAGGGSAGGAAAGGSAGGGTAGGSTAGGAAAGGDAGGSAGGEAGGGTAGGGSAGGTSSFGGGGPLLGGGSAAGGTAGGGTTVPGSGCGCSTGNAFAPFAMLGLLLIARRRRANH